MLSDSEGTRQHFPQEDVETAFEFVAPADVKVVILGEIVSAEGFDTTPVCVHYLYELPKDWRNDSDSSSLQGATSSCYASAQNLAHFSYSFYTQLSYSEDCDEDEIRSRPVVLVMVASMLDSTRVKFEGYGYFVVPSTPGKHEIQIRTWKPKARTIEEQMADCFIDISPSLQDVRAVHIPYTDGEECRRANRLGLQTEPSGSVLIRLHIIHQLPQNSKRSWSFQPGLMEKKSSETIFKSVQSVIDAFQRARQRAEFAKLNIGKTQI